MLNAAAAAFYYLRVVVYMFMREPQSEAAGRCGTAASCGPGSPWPTVLTIRSAWSPGLPLGLIVMAQAAARSSLRRAGLERARGQGSSRLGRDLDAGQDRSEPSGHDVGPEATEGAIWTIPSASIQ